jgi:hypothetical protein
MRLAEDEAREHDEDDGARGDRALHGGASYAGRI